jgi:hypothetical protein
MLQLGALDLSESRRCQAKRIEEKAAVLTMNNFSTTNLTGKNTIEGRRCNRCGAQPQLVNTMLDSAKGRIIRMFKCQCGEQTSVSDKA